MQNHEKYAFTRDINNRKSFLGPWEEKLIEWLTPKIPCFISSYTLTLLSIPCSLLIIGFSFLAQNNINWLWLVSLMILAQWFTDSFDGAVGRYRNTGLIRWGYYMDHFLDYVFLCSILIGYSFILPDNFKSVLFFILAIFGGFMVNAYLAFAATNKFKIEYLGFGPTEARIVFILVNTLLISFGKTHMAIALPYVLVFSTIGLIVVVYRTQKYIYEIDMKNKKNN